MHFQEQPQKYLQGYKHISQTHSFYQEPQNAPPLGLITCRRVEPWSRDNYVRENIFFSMTLHLSNTILCSHIIWPKDTQSLTHLGNNFYIYYLFSGHEKSVSQYACLWRSGDNLASTMLGLGSGHQTWQQALLSTKPSCLPGNSTLDDLIKQISKEGNY